MDMNTSLFMAVNLFCFRPGAAAAASRPVGNNSAQDIFLRPKTALN